MHACGWHASAFNLWKWNKLIRLNERNKYNGRHKRGPVNKLWTTAENWLWDIPFANLLHWALSSFIDCQYRIVRFHTIYSTTRNSRNKTTWPTLSGVSKRTRSLAIVPFLTPGHAYFIISSTHEYLWKGFASIGNQLLIRHSTTARAREYTISYCYF